MSSAGLSAYSASTYGASTLPSTIPRVDVKLSHRRLGGKPQSLRTKPSHESASLGELLPGALLVCIAEVVTADETWVRVYHGVHGGGYLPEGSMWRMKIEEAEGLAPFELLRKPRNIWPEPNRLRNADVTFTCTFNGRIDAFFEAMGSVLRHLDEVGTIDSWIIVCDRGATAEQRAEVMRALPWATVIGKGTALHGHAKTMNIILSLLRTRWWLQWEDDWTLTPSPHGGHGVLARAKEVCREGVHQVALNGAWLPSDAVWCGASGDSPHTGNRPLLEEHPSDGMGGSMMMDGAVNRWAEVKLPAEQRARIESGNESREDLIESYLRGVQHRTLPGRKLLWPLYSNQPSLNDSEFMRKLSFEEDAPLQSGAYWTFEFDFGVQFVRAGGRKATLRGTGSRHGGVGMLHDDSGGLAQQIQVASSSRETFRSESQAKAQRQAPSTIPIDIDIWRPQNEEEKRKALLEDSAARKLRFAGGCSIGNTTKPLPGGMTEASRELALDAVAETSHAGIADVNSDHVADLTSTLAAKGVAGALDELLALTAARGRQAAREKLLELGFGKVGERLKVENALIRSLPGVK